MFEVYDEIKTNIKKQTKGLEDNRSMRREHCDVTVLHNAQSNGEGRFDHVLPSYRLCCRELYCLLNHMMSMVFCAVASEAPLN